MKKEIKKYQKNNHKYVLNLRKNPTIAEIIVRDFLKRKGINFIFQKGFLKPFHRIVDFYLPKPYKIIIEVDGKYHNFIQTKDYIKDTSFLNFRNFKTVRITNEQVFNREFEIILDNIII